MIINTSTLKNSIEFVHQDNDLFFGVTASVIESLKETYNDKYEYILPDIILNKPLFNSDRYGYSEFETNLKVHNYDTNKSSAFCKQYGLGVKKYEFPVRSLRAINLAR